MMPPSPGNRDSPSLPLEASSAAPDPAASSPQSATSHANLSGTACPLYSRAYPWLLLLSTAMAAVFCFMYITKPEFPLAAPLGVNPLAPAGKPLVVPQKPALAQPLTPPDKSATVPAATVAEKSIPPITSMLPNAERLPGDSHPPVATNPPQDANPHPAPPASTPSPVFEETNLHIQHVLTAATPGGDLSRIVLNVPVLYQSRNLGWTESEVAESRELLKRLATYQENSRALREEGSSILAAWNHLVELSIPTPVLRADSPSLPANQDHFNRSEQPPALDTTHSIQIQPADK